MTADEILAEIRRWRDGNAEAIRLCTDWFGWGALDGLLAQAPTPPRRAAVAAVVYRLGPDGAEVLLGPRQAVDGHKQWASPGGAVENVDGGWEATARREALEEVGLGADDLICTAITPGTWLGAGADVWVYLRAKPGAVARAMEPAKCPVWEWRRLGMLASNMYPATQASIRWLQAYLGVCVCCRSQRGIYDAATDGLVCAYCLTAYTGGPANGRSPWAVREQQKAEEGW